MSTKEINTIKNICKYCLSNFQIRDSRLIASLICQLCRELDIDAPAVNGIIYVDINGFNRPFAHCFNVLNGEIIDCSIYSYALMNKSIEWLFPIFIAGTPPDHIEYVLNVEIKPDTQHKFKKEFLNHIISRLDTYNNVEIQRFNEVEDARKQNLFWCEMPEKS